MNDHDQGHLHSRSTAQRLLAHLADAARKVTVADVRIGLGYTAVKLSDGRTGVAYTFRDQAQDGCSVFTGIRPLSGRSASDLPALVKSHDVIEAAVGLACCNALANRLQPVQLGGDILEHLDVRPEDNVAMVGNFGPLVDPLRRCARSLTIFERVAAPTDLLRPRKEAAAALSRCQVAIITATSIINHTVDELLESAHACRQTALVGASTPLVSEAFQATGVDLLSGVVVTSPEEVLQVVSEGGGMRQFGPYVRKVTVNVSPVAALIERTTK